MMEVYVFTTTAVRIFSSSSSVSCARSCVCVEGGKGHTQKWVLCFGTLVWGERHTCRETSAPTDLHFSGTHPPSSASALQAPPSTCRAGGPCSGVLPHLEELPARQRATLLLTLQMRWWEWPGKKQEPAGATEQQCYMQWRRQVNACRMSKTLQAQCCMHEDKQAQGQRQMSDTFRLQENRRGSRQL